MKRWSCNVALHSVRSWGSNTQNGRSRSQNLESGKCSRMQAAQEGLPRQRAMCGAWAGLLVSASRGFWSCPHLATRVMQLGPSEQPRNSVHLNSRLHYSSSSSEWRGCLLLVIGDAGDVQQLHVKHNGAGGRHARPARGCMGGSGWGRAGGEQGKQAGRNGSGPGRLESAAGQQLGVTAVLPAQLTALCC